MSEYKCNGSLLAVSRGFLWLWCAVHCCAREKRYFVNVICVHMVLIIVSCVCVCVFFVVRNFNFNGRHYDECNAYSSVS